MGGRGSWGQGRNIGIDGVLGLFRDPRAEEIGHEGRDKEQRWARWSKVRCLCVGIRGKFMSVLKRTSFPSEGMRRKSLERSKLREGSGGFVF